MYWFGLKYRQRLMNKLSKNGNIPFNKYWKNCKDLLKWVILFFNMVLQLKILLQKIFVTSSVSFTELFSFLENSSTTILIQILIQIKWFLRHIFSAGRKNISSFCLKSIDLMRACKFKRRRGEFCINAVSINCASDTCALEIWYSGEATSGHIIYILHNIIHAPVLGRPNLSAKPCLASVWFFCSLAKTRNGLLLIYHLKVYNISDRLLKN